MRNSFPAWYLRKGKKKATDDAIERASSSCGRWEWGCAAVVVLSVSAEFALALVHPSYDSPWNRFGSATFDALIALGIVGEVIFGRIDAGLQTELRDRSSARLGDAIVAAGDANARAAEARLETEKLKERMAARVLTPEQQQAIADELSVFKGQRVYLVAAPSTSETEGFVTLLAHVFDLAGWEIVGTNSSLKPLFVIPTGVIVQWFVPSGTKDWDSPDAKPAFAVCQCLNKSGIRASVFGGPIQSMGAITVIVNTKE